MGTGVSFALNMLLLCKSAWCFYFPFLRGWEILLGASYAFSSGSVVRWQKLCSLLGAAMIFGSVFFIAEDIAWPNAWALFPTLGTLSLIAAGQSGFLSKLLAHPVMVYLGRISYPLYLIHWPVIAMVHIVRPAAFVMPLKLYLIGASILCAALFYEKVECKLRYKKRATSWLIVLMLGAAGIGLLMWLNRFPTYVQRKFPQKLAIFEKMGEPWPFPGDLKPFAYNSPNSFKIDSFIKESVLFVGDSNMQQYAPRINYLVKGNPADYKSVIFVTMQGAMLIPHLNKNGVDRTRQDIAEFLKISQNVSTVVFAFAWLVRFKNEALKCEISKFEVLLKELTHRGKKIYLVLSMPSGDNYSPHYWFQRDFMGHWSFCNPKCSAADWKKKSFQLHLELRKIAFRIGAVVIDPSDFLCDTCFCKVFEGDMPIYRDGWHLYPGYVRTHINFLDYIIQAE